MLWEVAISFTLMGGGHPCILIYLYITVYASIHLYVCIFVYTVHIYNRYTKCTEYVYLKLNEMTTSSSKWNGVTIMPSPLRWGMAHLHGEEDWHPLQFEKEGGDIL